MALRHLHKLPEPSGIRFDTIGGLHLDTVVSDSTVAAVGRIGMGLNADASFGYVETTSIVPDFDGGDLLSIILWIKFNDAPGLETHPVSLGLGGGQTGRLRRQINGKLQWTIRPESGPVTSLNTVTNTQAGLWYHLAMTWRRAGTMRLYLNNVEERLPIPVPDIRLLPMAGNPLVRYGANILGTQQVDAVIDEVGYWDEELSLFAVGDNWNDGIGQDLPLVAAGAPVAQQVARRRRRIL